MIYLTIKHKPFTDKDVLILLHISQSKPYVLQLAGRPTHRKENIKIRDEVINV